MKFRLLSSGRFIPALLALSAATAVAFASMEICRPGIAPPDGAPILAFDPRLVIGRICTAEYKLYNVAIDNRSASEVRLVGGTSFCTKQMCAITEKFPVLIPPRARYVVPIKFGGGSAGGKFTEQVSLYTDCPEQPIVVINVTGETMIPATEPVGLVR